jgi:rubredoxin|nr:MAG TPA: rubredoxin iron binding domains containing a [Caudoviricetes sp.]
MIYRCMCCHLIFDDPDVMRRRENLDGERGYALVTEMFCPDCGAEEMYFEELEETEDG